MKKAEGDRLEYALFWALIDIRPELAMSFISKCRKIVCVGRNYAAHAKELGNAVPTSPVLFLKPPSSLLAENTGPILIPPGCENIHHEVELGIVIGKTGKNINEADAESYIKGYFLGLDMTARSLQASAKSKGLPWSVSKGYDTFAPVSGLIDKKKINHKDASVWLKVDGELKQEGNTSHMMFNIPFLISHISTIFTLQEDDLIFTGTPSGVGPVTHGQTIECGIEGVQQMTFTVQSTPAKL
jgi:acylpyruvate hydrolase